MRFLLLSDIHANLEALEAVVEDARGLYQEVICLGDLVGYGPDPNEVTAWVRQNCRAVIRGNHDRASIDLAETRFFNPVAASAAEWTNTALEDTNKEYLQELPAGPLRVDGFDMVHGSPADEDAYVVTAGDALEPLRALGAGLVFFGHTHIQGGFSLSVLGTTAEGISTLGLLEVNAECGYLVNPGSVGQPRDNDWRAAYGIYDSSTGEVEFRRCLYGVELTQRKIADAGLHELLAERLALGR